MNSLNGSNTTNLSIGIRIVEEFPEFSEYLKNKNFEYYQLPTFVLHSLYFFLKEKTNKNQLDIVKDILFSLENTLEKGSPEERNIIGDGFIENICEDKEFQKQIFPYLGKNFIANIKSY